MIVEELKTNLVSLAILFHLLCAQHVSDINMSIIRSLRPFCRITTLVVLFLVRCVLEEQYDQCGDSREWSQAPDDGHINVRNILNT